MGSYWWTTQVVFNTMLSPTGKVWEFCFYSRNPTVGPSLNFQNSSTVLLSASDPLDQQGELDVVIGGLLLQPHIQFFLRLPIHGITFKISYFLYQSSRLPTEEVYWYTVSQFTYNFKSLKNPRILPEILDWEHLFSINLSNPCVPQSNDLYCLSSLSLWFILYLDSNYLREE